MDRVTGMAWPEGQAQDCFRMADACVIAAHRVVAGIPLGTIVASRPDPRKRESQPPFQDDNQSHPVWIAA